MRERAIIWALAVAYLITSRLILFLLIFGLTLFIRVLVALCGAAQ